MKLIRFGKKGEEKPGILIKNKRYDCSSYFHDWNNNFFKNDGIERLTKIINTNLQELPEVDINARWGACVGRPGMILCVGLNYSDHAREAGLEIPKEPILFMKATNTLNGPFDNIQIPKRSKKTDWEIELAMVIKKDALYLNNEEEAKDYIAGYTIFNDVSEREFQIERNGQWTKGKSCPGFSPVGPALVTPDEVGDEENLRLTLLVNGEKAQDASTKTMIFKPKFLVYYISQFMQLEAGDIIATGTPPGVGMGMKPPKFLSSGDQVELKIENLGIQKQTFI
jgi:2,4-didehydro-3-deoxy-L-rhamnonate hydrolase